MNIIGITGLAGSGKDTAADVLVKRFRFTRISLADDIKRICMGVFSWGEDRLWGPSERRNEPDPNYGGLTARHALQQLGTEWGRACYQDLWVDKTIGAARYLLDPEGWWRGAGRGYSRTQGTYGLHSPEREDLRETHYPQGVIVPDVRFANEVAAIHAVGGKIWRITRPGAGLEGAAGAHASEIGIASLAVDVTIQNRAGLEDLERDVVFVAKMVGLEEMT